MLEAAGAAIDFWRIAMKPGKPMIVGNVNERKQGPANGTNRIQPAIRPDPANTEWEKNCSGFKPLFKNKAFG